VVRSLSGSPTVMSSLAIITDDPVSVVTRHALSPICPSALRLSSLSSSFLLASSRLQSGWSGTRWHIIWFTSCVTFCKRCRSQMLLLRKWLFFYFFWV
jgi:hypothetical protein